MADVEDRSKDEEKHKAPGASRVDLDYLLVNEIGQIGKYQFRTIALTAIIVIFAGSTFTEYVFTAARISTRCVISECDAAEPEFAPSWILNAIPGTSASSFENCERFVNNTADSGIDQTCPASLFDQQNTQECDGYVYETTNTVVYDFNLACDEWRRSLIGSFCTFGTLTALPITGFISDRWGRRTALVINAFNTAWIGLTKYWADTYVGFVIGEFCEATFGAGVLSSAFILIMEVVGPKYRVYAGACMNSSFALGHMYMGMLAWGLVNWRKLTLALYIPPLTTIAFFWILAESVRWLLSKGRFEESEKILKNIARVNGRELSEKSLEGLKITTAEAQKNAMLAKDENEPWLPVLVFRHKPVFIRCLVSPIWWITCTLVIYGMSINAVNMLGNPYLNYVLVVGVEIPGFFFAAFVIGIVGRKPAFIASYWICAVCQIAFIFIPDDMFGLSLTVYLVGKFCIAMVSTIIYVYTAELYPTRYRHSLFAFSSMIGRIGSIMAPLTPALSVMVWDPLPSVLYAGMCVLSGSLVFITPETLNTKMPDTMEDAANLGKKKP